MLSNEVTYKELSIQMEAQAIRYLREQTALFSEAYLEDKALSLLLRKNIKQVIKFLQNALN